MALRRPDTCSVCGASIRAGSQAEWNPTLKTVTCLICAESRDRVEVAFGTLEHLDRGTPGASAKRKYDRLHEKREREAKEKLGRRIGGIYLAFSEDPQSTRAWGVGSKGEQLLGGYLESLNDESRVIVLHDRRIPGSRANIDHIAVCRQGVFAIDAKKYAGKVQRVDKGGWFSTDERLYVGRRDCTKLVNAMRGQVEAIQSALGAHLIQEFEVDVRAALCFVDAEWSLFAKPFALAGVWVGWAKALGERLLADGPLSADHLATLARRVATALPPA
jgi:Nuclease-related domain